MAAEAVGVRGGLATLGAEALALRSALEERFLSWAADVGAPQAQYPALMPVEALSRFDYFDNFPHLGVMCCGLSAETIEAGRFKGGGVTEVPGEALEAAHYALPSAACYNVYLDLEGRTLDGPYKVTTVANCFRRETHYDHLRRLLGFTMREIVCVGEREAVLEHVGGFKERVSAFLAELGLPVEIVPSSDPFYEADASRALMAQLFPVKEEIVFDGSLAIGSLNFHRNFFGERCDIRTADGEHAFSGCVAFGLERWISALTTHFGEEPARLIERLGATG